MSSISGLLMPSASSRFRIQPSCKTRPSSHSRPRSRASPARPASSFKLWSCFTLISVRPSCTARMAGRLARAPGVEKHNLAVQVMEQLGPPLEPPHTDAIVLPEAKLADPPVRRDVLVLLADGLAAKLNLDLAGFPGQLFRGHQLALVAVQSMQQADHHAAGGPQAGPFGRHVGQHSDLDGRLNARAHQRLANQLMLQVANLVDDLFLGIADVNQVVETRRHDYIDIFIDRRTDHQAFVLSIVTREIGRASREANAQWCLRNDHLRRCLHAATDAGFPCSVASGKNCWRELPTRFNISTIMPHGC